LLRSGWLVSIPQFALEELLKEKRTLESARRLRIALSGTANTNADAKENLAFQRRWFRRFEDVLHANVGGPVWLRDERLAEIVHESLLYRDGKSSVGCVLRDA